MPKLILLYIAFITLNFSWAGPEVGGDVPSRIPEEIQHAPVPATSGEAKQTSSVPNPWDKFMGRLIIGLEQAPLKSFQDGRYRWIDWDGEEKAIFRSRTRYPAPFLLTVSPFELFGSPDTNNSYGPNLLHEIYSLKIGFGGGSESSFNVESQVLLPVFRSGITQVTFGSYLSTFFFRDGNPYWSVGLMGYGGVLLTPQVMLRVGLMHTMYDYLKAEEDVLNPDDGEWEVEDLPRQYFVKPNSWRMSISLSFSPN